ncbi:MAG: pseudouridine synthase [Polyangiales bacterium]
MKRAVTHVRVARRAGERALLEVTPETGRTHQIRVQCAAAGMPLVGDLTYGGAPAPRLMLHAASLTIPDPATGRARTFTAPTPAVFDAWLRDEPDPRALRERLRDAADHRWFLARDPAVTAFRLAHDGDGIAGHAVDVYGEHAVVHAFDGAVDEALLDALMEASFAGVYAKFRPKQANTLVDTRRDAVAPALTRCAATTRPTASRSQSTACATCEARRRALDGDLPRPAREPAPRARALRGEVRAQPLRVHGPLHRGRGGGRSVAHCHRAHRRRAPRSTRPDRTSSRTASTTRSTPWWSTTFAWLRGALARKER